MTEIISPSEIQSNSSTDAVSNTNQSTETIETENPTRNSGEIEEPPVKKCKFSTNDKSRALEDRIGSILSCCICLDLSTLAMFQVRLRLNSPRK